MVQPIDLHTELARSDTTTRVQQVADRAALNAQQRHAHEAEEKRSQVETNVLDKDEIDGEHLDDHDRRGEQYRARRKRKEKEDAERHSSTDQDRMAAPITDEGTKLDVSI